MSEEKKIITCAACGHEHEEQVKFCSDCGARMEEGYLAAEPVVVDDAVVTEAEGVVLEPTIQQEEPVIESVIEPAYVEIPSPTVYTTVEPEVSVPTGNGSPGFAIASMILGILSLICCCLWPLSVLCSIAAIVLGIVALYNKYDGRGMAIAGIVTGAVAIVVLVLMLVLVGTAGIAEALQEYY